MAKWGIREVNKNTNMQTVENGNQLMAIDQLNNAKALINQTPITYPTKKKRCLKRR